ncbi:MAG: 30S ribosomal protein S5 [Mycoplasmataceae bacterium]|jgi:small subunit ribosomal protein S5|nr:30S ribosomal protein S5 [Mycoplasmataceae bacterium]
MEEEIKDNIVKEETNINSNNEKKENQQENSFSPSSNNHRFSKPRSNRVYSANRSSSGYEEKVVNIKRINKTTKGGRRMRFSALVVIGDRQGHIGFGIGKSIEVPVAIKKALSDAQNKINTIIMDKNASVFHEVIGKTCASKVLIKPAKKGTGLISGGAVRTVVELAGFKNIYTKILGSNTAINTVQATINALRSQRTPKTISNIRGKEMKEL